MDHEKIKADIVKRLKRELKRVKHFNYYIKQIKNINETNISLVPMTITRATYIELFNADVYYTTTVMRDDGRKPMLELEEELQYQTESIYRPKVNTDLEKKGVLYACEKLGLLYIPETFLDKSEDSRNCFSKMVEIVNKQCKKERRFSEK